MIVVTPVPFRDPDARRRGRDWVVVTRDGSIVTHHRFRTESDALAFVVDPNAVPAVVDTIGAALIVVQSR